MDGYEIVVQEFLQDVTGILPGTPCKRVPLLGYDGVTPGPLIIGRTGVQDVTRFTNRIPVDSKFFPAGGPGDRGGEGAPSPAAAFCIAVTSRSMSMLQPPLPADHCR